MDHLACSLNGSDTRSVVSSMASTNKPTLVNLGPATVLDTCGMASLNVTTFLEVSPAIQPMPVDTGPAIVLGICGMAFKNQHMMVDLGP